MFSDKLNEYCEELGCTGKELSDSSGLSAAVISRYRKGERVPLWESEQLIKLSRGISKIANIRGIEEYTQNFVLDSFKEFTQQTGEGDKLAENLNALISILGINVTKMARYLSYDASYISRIRTGQRKPSDREGFAKGVASYVVNQYSDESHKATLANLTGCETQNFADEYLALEAIKNWLCSVSSNEAKTVDNFLHKLDEFDLNEYIRAIKFNELKVPTMPFQLQTSRNYYGLEEMKKGELDFFKATVFSKSNEPVFMCSDMPMEDMVDDEFPKKWMFGLAVMIKKGLHINVVHNVNRPFEEMMLGLEGWIPIYMTGQVSPYYIKGIQNKVYSRLNYVSGSAALCGECISGFHDKGKYYLTKNKEEVAYYKEKAKCLLEKTSPLMEIYTNDTANAYNAFVYADAKEMGERLGVLSAPPLYTISYDVLKNILAHNDIEEDESEKIINYVRKIKENMQNILSHSKICDKFASLTKEEFEEYPLTLVLSGMFFEKDIKYSYEDYEKHIESTGKFALENENYSIKIMPKQPFRNIQIIIHKGRWAMVSKSKSPTAHFVIRHPLLRDAIENITAPIFLDE